MDNQNITDIFFDLDHTLWDFDKNSGLAFERVFKTFEIPLQLEEFLAVYEPINLQYWRLYREERIEKQALRRGRLGDAFAQFDLSYPLDTIDAMAEQYIEELPKDNYLFDGATELLEYLQPNYRLHLITNGFHGVQHRKIQNSGIAHFFETVTTSEDVGAKKPNPKVFEHALALAGATANTAMMIGDSFEADILGAEAVGFKTIFFNYRNQDVEQGRIAVNSLDAIKNHL
jgi:putative hydrolase of the HAD superfamily